MKINTPERTQEPDIFLATTEQDGRAFGYALTTAGPEGFVVHRYLLGDRTATRTEVKDGLNFRHFSDYRRAQDFIRHETGSEAYAFDVESDMPRGIHARAMLAVVRNYFDLS